jgi:phage tail tape-measure protein
VFSPKAVLVSVRLLAAVGAAVGATVGTAVGATVGGVVGAAVGAAVGTAVGLGSPAGFAPESPPQAAVTVTTMAAAAHSPITVRQWASGILSIAYASR